MADSFLQTETVTIGDMPVTVSKHESLSQTWLTHQHPSVQSADCVATVSEICVRCSSWYKHAKKHVIEGGVS